MMDLINRQVAIEAIAKQSKFSVEEIINICDASVQDENGWLGGLKEAILAVSELPSVQPDRKRGKWLMADDIPSICSNCGANWIDDYVDSRELYITGKIPNHCPNCGSDNRGEKE